MKVSVSLPSDDITFLDAYARDEGLPSRSAALHEAVRELRRMARAAALSTDYADAWEEWASSGEAAAWDATVGDGLAG